MEMLIKTENAAQFIVDNFISTGYRRAEFGNSSFVSESTKDEVLISNKSGLNVSDTLIIYHEQRYNDRCSVCERFTYELSKHDSVSLKGTLTEYLPWVPTVDTKK